jgi:hypothetical protein
VRVARHTSRQPGFHRDAARRRYGRTHQAARKHFFALNKNHTTTSKLLFKKQAKFFSNHKNVLSISKSQIVLTSLLKKIYFFCAKNSGV